MGKEFQDGLLIDKSFLIIDEKKPGIRILVRIVQILAIIICSWSSISIFVDALNIPVDIIVINFAIVICTGILFLLFMIRSYDLVKLFFITLFYVLYFLSRLPRLANGFYLLENLVIDRMAVCYNYSGYYFEADYYNDIEDTTRFVVMLLIPMVVFLTIAIVRNRLVKLSGLLLFLPVLASFLLGVIPSEIHLIPYLVSALYLARSAYSFRHTVKGDHLTLIHRINSRAAIWLSLFGLLLFFFLKLFVPREVYNNISEMDDVKTDVQSAFLNISIEDIATKFSEYKLFDYNSGIGGLRGGELGKDGNVVYTDSEQLEVKAPANSLYKGIYLKGYVGTDYTGDSWEGHSAADRKLYNNMLKSLSIEEFQPVNQMNLLLDLMVDKLSNFGDVDLDFLSQTHIFQGTMDIKYIDANKKYIYAPYYTDYSLLDQITYEQDLYAAPSEQKDEYEFNFYYDLYLGSSDYTLLRNLKGSTKDYANYEQAYRNYVYKVYTKLPEKGLERIKKDFSPSNNKEEGTSVSEKIAYVKDYLNTETKYTLSPGKLPNGKDYVEYFLYENKKGYCAHYASTATLMLRTMGVPARYVEGYVAKYVNSSLEMEIDENKTITAYSLNGELDVNMPSSEIKVTDRNAHAWVEVYIDGCGWIPVEFTPGAALEFDSAIVDDLAKTDSFLDKAEEAKDTPTQKPSEPSPTVTEPASNQEKERTDKKDSSHIISNTKNNSGLNSVFFAAFSVLLIIGLSLFLISKIRKARRVKDSRNRNKRALYVFTEIEKILSYCNCLPNRRIKLEDCEAYVKERSRYVETKTFEGCMKIIKKARFSNQSITINELDEIENFRENLLNEASEELSLRKKIHLKIMLLM